MAKQDTDGTLRDDLCAAWQRYVDLIVPLRPTLHAYCRRLTGSVWDAEDLAQETLLRAFGRWGVTYPAIRDLRPYLLRTATNVWIDGLRRRSGDSIDAAEEARHGSSAEDVVERASEVREASRRVLQRLSPKERAAIVLKEAFDMTLEEIADLLAATPGAVKSALHRGREHLHEPEGAPASRRPQPSAALLDRFVERYNARDVPGLLSLMLDGVAVENVGNSYHAGADPTEGAGKFLDKLVFGHPEWPREFHYESMRLLPAEIEGEPILIALTTRRGREALEVVFRFEEEDGKIARLRGYAFCPETIRAVGEILGRRVRTGIYRAPTPAPGAEWPKPGKSPADDAARRI